MRKKLEIGGGGGHAISNYTPPKPTSPPYPIKNERSLELCYTSAGLAPFSALLKTRSHLSSFSIIPFTLRLVTPILFLHLFGTH